MAVPDQQWISGPLTCEIADVRSPVRQFLNERFTAELRPLQQQYRQAAPSLIIEPADKRDANPGTVGTAADWLLRFLLHPQPGLGLPFAGLAECAQAGLGLLSAYAQVLAAIGISGTAAADGLRSAAGLGNAHTSNCYDGPAAGSTAEPELLSRACWATALLTEAFRGGADAALRGPLGLLAGKPKPAGEDLLALAPAAGLDQLRQFRQVFTSALVPRLAGRRGRWAAGPEFTGSALIGADADLIAAGLLLELKTSAARFSLPVTDLFQVIGYALLDFDDEFGLTSLGIFSARYGRLTTWEISPLLCHLAGGPVSLPRVRREFRGILLAHQPPDEI
jgi:hypothetical protein